jgi:hypothetical protein
LAEPKGRIGESEMRDKLYIGCAVVSIALIAMAWGIIIKAIAG